MDSASGITLGQIYKAVESESGVHYVGKLRQMTDEFKQQIDEATREAELEEVRKAIEGVRNSSRVFDLDAPRH
jgi:hypothetical protein